MKALAVALLFLPALSFAADQPGRYQIIPGHYHIIKPNGEDYDSPALFRIDTATGETWIAQQTSIRWQDGREEVKRGWEKFDFHVEMPKERR